MQRLCCVLLLMMGTVTTGQSQGVPSFKSGIDCGGAGRDTALGRWVCVDAEVARLSELLNKTYRALQASANDEGRYKLQKANNDWLDQVDDLCGKDRSKGCIVAFLNSRLKQLGVTSDPASGVHQVQAPAASVGNKPSFNCGAAKSASARLICSDAELSNADGALGKAFQNVVGSLSPGEKKAKVQEQVNWIRERNTRCQLDGKLTAPVEELLPSKSCVLEAINARINEYAGVALSPQNAECDVSVGKCQASSFTNSKSETLASKDILAQIKGLKFEWQVYCQNEKSMPPSYCAGRAPCWLYSVSATTTFKPEDVSVVSSVLGDNPKMTEFLEYIGSGSRAYCENQVKAGKLNGAPPAISTVSVITDIYRGPSFSAYQPNPASKWEIEVNYLGDEWNKTQRDAQIRVQVQAAAETCSHDRNAPDLMCVRLGMRAGQLPAQFNNLPIMPSPNLRGAYQTDLCFPAGGKGSRTDDKGNGVTCIYIYFTGVGTERIVQEVDLLNLKIGNFQFFQNGIDTLTTRFGPYTSQINNLYQYLAWNTPNDFYQKIGSPTAVGGTGLDGFARGYPQFLKSIPNLGGILIAGVLAYGPEVFADIVLIDVPTSMRNLQQIDAVQAQQKDRTRQLELQAQPPPKF